MKINNSEFNHVSHVSLPHILHQYLQHYLRNMTQKSVYSSLENGEITQFYFLKLAKIQYCLSFTVAINMVIIIVSESITFPTFDAEDIPLVAICLNFNIICLIIEIIALYLRVQTILKLEKQQKTLYQKSTIFSTRRFFYLLLEYLIIVFQPYYFLNTISYQTENAYDNYNFMFPVNDLLTIMSLGRTYIVFRTLLLLTTYMGNRSNRLCKMYGCKADFVFSLKCLFKDNPLFLIVIFFTTSIIIFAYALYIAQRHLILYNLKTQKGICDTYLNAVWLIMMTITTVGYGDYYPHTFVGRIIILFVAIWGSFIISIMVVVVANTLNMQKNQRRTLMILQKINSRDQLRIKAKQFIGYFLLYKKYIKQQNQQQIKKYSKIVKKLKGQFSDLNKKLKIMRDNDDIYDQISSHFLNLNSDIQILNTNQQKIIDFIHKYLQYHEENSTNQ